MSYSFQKNFILSYLAVGIVVDTAVLEPVASWGFDAEGEPVQLGDAPCSG